jgi:hypothetical protein
MTWQDVVAPFMVIGLMGEILYFIVSSEAVRGNQWRRSQMRPGRDIAALGRLLRRRWRRVQHPEKPSDPNAPPHAPGRSG